MKKTKKSNNSNIPARMMSILLTAALCAGSFAVLPVYAADNNEERGSVRQMYSAEPQTDGNRELFAVSGEYTDSAGQSEADEAYDVSASAYEVSEITEEPEQETAPETTDGETSGGETETGIIDIAESKVIIARKKTVQLHLEAYPEGELIWSSSKPSVAEVSEDGLVSAKSVGTAVIRCASAENEEIYDSCTIYVRLGRNETTFLAHKGYSGIAPENTLPAIREAVRAGFDGVELDVYELKKEKRKKYKPFILISHDNTLRRLTGKKGKIERLTHKNYKKYKIRYHVNGIESYGVQTFPTIEQAMKTAWREAAKQGKKNFIIELDIKQKTISKSAVKRIIRLAGKHRVRINSPHYQVIKKFKKYRKHKTTELWMFKDVKTVKQRRAFIAQAAKLKVKGVSMPAGCWNKSLIRYAKKKHLRLATKTNSPKEAQKLIDKGFERVCTGKKIFAD